MSNKTKRNEHAIVESRFSTGDNILVVTWDFPRTEPENYDTDAYEILGVMGGMAYVKRISGWSAREAIISLTDTCHRRVVKICD